MANRQWTSSASPTPITTRTRASWCGSASQAHALRVGEAGYLSRLLLPSDDGTHGFFLLLGCALQESTCKLFESADWGEAAIEISAQIPDEMWNDALQAHVQISRDNGTDRFNEVNHPPGARPILDYESGERINDPNEAS